MRTVLAVVVAIVIIVLVLFGLYQCGPLDWAANDDSELSELDALTTLEADVMKPAVYDDDDEDIVAPDYTTVRLPAADRLSLELDAREYIAEQAQPSEEPLEVDETSQFVGAQQTFVVDGETVTLIQMLDNAANDASQNSESAVSAAQQQVVQQQVRQLQQNSDGSLFYVHSVTTDDAQGIWGVVQTGLKDRFARGLGMKRDEQTKIFQVDIPTDADERVNKRSSFLGKVLHQKVRQSMVYNQKNGKIGVNPDVIFPGQELVIIEFKPDELISIYEYFITQVE